MNFTPLLLLLTLALFAWYLSLLAGRLDRLHHRVETSWANLDGLLQRRAAIALEIARSDFADPASSLLLTFASHQAREASVKDRSQAESGLSGALAILRETSGAHSDLAVQDLFRELGELNAKIEVAVALHVESVNRTQLIRSKWIIRTFRLAGSAPLPVTYEFESDVL